MGRTAHRSQKNAAPFAPHELSLNFGLSLIKSAISVATDIVNAITSVDCLDRPLQRRRDSFESWQAPWPILATVII